MEVFGQSTLVIFCQHTPQRLVTVFTSQQPADRHPKRKARILQLNILMQAHGSLLAAGPLKTVTVPELLVCFHKAQATECVCLKHM